MPTENVNKWTGIVTLTRVTHATPAGTYAHTPSRKWEYKVPSSTVDGDRCKDIAWQLVNENNDIRVLYDVIYDVIYVSYYDLI